MDQDIQIWLDSLKKVDKLSGKKRSRSEAFNKSITYKEAELNLKYDSIISLYNMIKKTTMKNRQLTIYLSNLEKLFTLSRRINKNKYSKIIPNNETSLIKKNFLLGLVALLSVSLDIIQDIKLKIYESGRKFNVLKYLEKLMISIKDKIKNLSPNKKRRTDVKDSIDDVEYEEFSENETSDDEDDEEEEEEEYDDGDEEDFYINITKQGYYKDGFIIDDDCDDCEDCDDGNNDSELDCVELVDTYSKDNVKLNRKFLNEIKKFSNNYQNSKDESIKYFCNLDQEIRKDVLDKLKKINQVDSTGEPQLFKIINMDIKEEFKNHIITQYFNICNSCSDNSKLKNWLNNVMKIPFGKYKGTDLNQLKTSKDISKFVTKLKDNMDSAVYGHDNAKRKIIQLMGQKITNPDAKGGVLGIWGPPGNGKTTMIKEGIAKAMDKPFVFISLGGATDASFMEGHSITYEGSIYGRIMQGIIDSKCMNPIIYFDELDKISKTRKGDEITNLLVHLIDPVQNCHFRDKYFFGLEFDFSKITFMFSFNEPHKINHILMDRITTVETKYLLETQKKYIVENYLMDDILKDLGLKKDSINFPSDVIEYLINSYTREGGVRKLKSLLYSICREVNVAQLTNTEINGRKISYPYIVSKREIPDLIKEITEISKDKIHTKSNIGIVNGLWASGFGIGGVLPIETLLYPSKGLLDIKATGSLEKVIKESIEVACSLAWSRIDDTTREEWLTKWKKQPQGFHIHCPEGAIPKDGPSAGTALTLAIYSLLTNKPVNNEVAMTGEINLRGEILKIGGLEEKLEGAKRAGVKHALIPKDNSKDLDKIIMRNSKLFDDSFRVTIVNEFSDVLEHTLI